MPSSSTTYTVASHFRGRAPELAATYAALLSAVKSLGPVREEAKKTSIHLCRNSAFAGIATQRAGLLLTLKSATDIQSPRVHRREQASANRWHLVVKLGAASDVDAELKRWLRAAYVLGG